MKKFYSEVAVAGAEGNYSVVLDERILRTPGKVHCALPTSNLADAIAAEWRAQNDEIDAKSMPLTMIVNAAVDRVAPKPGYVIDTIMRFATTDLLCYRAERPARLVDKQNKSWQPLLDWASEDIGVKLEVTVGVVPVVQDRGAISSLREGLLAYDHFRLTILQILTETLGSIILALAVLEGRVDVEQAIDASQLDEIFQANQWGEDEVANARREAIREEVKVAAHFLTLL